MPAGWRSLLVGHADESHQGQPCPYPQPSSIERMEVPAGLAGKHQVRDSDTRGLPETSRAWRLRGTRCALPFLVCLNRAEPAWRSTSDHSRRRVSPRRLPPGPQEFHNQGNPPVRFSVDGHQQPGLLGVGEVPMAGVVIPWPVDEGAWVLTIKEPLPDSPREEPGTEFENASVAGA